MVAHEIAASPSSLRTAAPDLAVLLAVDDHASNATPTTTRVRKIAVSMGVMIHIEHHHEARAIKQSGTS